MWLAYNKRILKFYQENRCCSYLLNVESIRTDYSLIKSLNTKWSLNLDCILDFGFKPEIFVSEVDEIIFKPLSPSLTGQCDELFLCLNKYADTGQTITPRIINSKKVLDRSLLELINNHIDKTTRRNYAKDFSLIHVKNSSEKDFDIEDLKTLKNNIISSINNNDIDKLGKIRKKLAERFELNAEALLCEADINIALKEYEKAEKNYLIAISLKPYVYEIRRIKRGGK